MVEADFTGDGAVVLKFGVAVAGGFVHFVEAFPCEVDAGLGVAAIESAGHRAEAEFTAARIIEGNVAGTEKVDELLVPQFHLDDPPFAGERVGHVAASSSLGNRTRL